MIGWKDGLKIGGLICQGQKAVAEVVGLKIKDKIFSHDTVSSDYPGKPKIRAKSHLRYLLVKGGHVFLIAA